MTTEVDLTLSPTYSVSMTLTGDAGSIDITTADGALLLELAPVLRGEQGPAGTAGSIEGAAPIQVATVEDLATISITAATTLAAGSMSAADKAKLDGITPGGGAWGSITGTLSDQTDLQTALNGKETAGAAAAALVTALAADITAHSGLSGIGTNTHAQIDTALTRLANTSGTNTGDQDLSSYATTAAVAAGYQPLDSDLTAIAALTTTTYGRALLALADAAAGRTALGLGTAATTAASAYEVAGAAAAAQAASQPLDSDLTAIAALTTTTFGRALLALADAAALRTAAGLGTLATQSGTFSGTSSGTNTGDQTTVSGNAGTATALATGRTIDGTTFDGTANITVIAPGTHAATGKTTPVDADELPLVDSAASNVLKKVTWANVKATLKTYFDALYQVVLVSGTNIKTINGTTLLGAGDLAISGAGGDVTGPASAVNSNVVLFSGTTGKIIKDSGLALSGSNTGDQTITLTGAVTGTGTGSFATTIATPGNLSVSSTNSTATAHTHAITSSSAPGAAASILATDASGILGSTGTRLVKLWATDITVTNAITGSVTGSAATLTTARSIYGNNFDGSAALGQVIASTFGGTGNGFAKLSGPATTEKTFTLPNASATILTDNAAVTAIQGGTGLTGYAAGDILYANSTTTLAALPKGADGQYLKLVSGVPAWAAGGAGGASTLDAVTAAAGAASINNGDNAIAWNWSATTAGKTVFSVTENAASTNGVGSQVLLKVGTIAASTADPLQVQTRGVDTIRVSRTGAVTITALDGTNGSGATGSAVAITGGQGVLNSGVGGAVTVTSGDGGGNSGNSGAVTIKSGATASGTSGSVTISTGTNSSGATGAVSISTAAPSSATAAGIITLQPGASGASPGASSVTITGSNAASIASVSGGGVTITGGFGSAATTGGSGGAITIAGGLGGLAAAGGDINITTGAGGATGLSGALTLASGGTTNANTGTVTLQSGTPSGTNRSSGTVTVQSGAPIGTGSTGIVTIQSGSVVGAAASGNVVIKAGTTRATGGDVVITGAAAGATASIAGGAASLTGGTGSTTTTGGTGGAASVTGGLGGLAAAGGAAALTGGRGGATGAGGAANVISGAGGSSSGNSGDVTIGSGTVTSGTAGNVLLKTAGTTQLQATPNGVIVSAGAVPATAASTGSAGQIAWDSGFLYVCVAANTWKRTALTTF